MNMLAAGTFNPADEFALKQWIGIHLGPIDLSINKAVVYLAISALLTILLGLFTMRSRLALLPSKRQTVGGDYGRSNDVGGGGLHVPKTIHHLG